MINQVYYLKQIKDVLKAVEIKDNCLYWFSEQQFKIKEELYSFLSESDILLCLEEALQNLLYSNFYCQGGAIKIQMEFLGAQATKVTPFIQSLSASNVGKYHFDDNWQLIGKRENYMLVEKQGLLLWANEKECKICNKMISVSLPNEIPLSGGYFYFFSNNSLVEDNLLRFYFNLFCEGAPVLVKTITNIFNSKKIPFNLKLLNDPSQYSRCDAGVLYINQIDLSVSLKIIFNQIHPEISPYLKIKIPAFTKLILPGIGFAEDTDTGESFGMNRCSILSRAIIDSYNKFGTNKSLYLKNVKNNIKPSFSLSHPYLNRKSKENLEKLDTIKIKKNFVPEQHLVDNRILLEIAQKIGDKICNDAIWCQNSCNWISKNNQSENIGGLTQFSGNGDILIKNLGAELYSGVSGIAIFLATLYCQTKKEIYYKTTLGAIEYLKKYLQSNFNFSGEGLFTGKEGIIFSLLILSRILKLKDSISINFLQKHLKTYSNIQEYDLLSGKAGVILSLILINKLYPIANISTVVKNLGDSLIKESLVDERNAKSWKSYHFHSSKNLTGLSHGASGVAYSLIELYNFTKIESYKQAALMAFRYENNSLNLDIKDWPDFRFDNKNDEIYNSFWCHGSPGILIARMQAVQSLIIKKDDKFLNIALKNTRTAIKNSLNSNSYNYSICHGIIGNAEIILEYSKIHSKGSDQLLHDVLSLIIRDYKLHPDNWFTGNGNYNDPSLFLGLSGLGFFLLKNIHRNLPSFLMLTSDKLNFS